MSIDLVTFLYKFGPHDGTQLGALIGTVIALCGLWKGVMEYVKQGRQKRSETFTEIQKILNTDPDIFKITTLLENNDQDNDRLRHLPAEKRREFLVLFEHIALLTNSGLIRRNVSRYMFGYYAARCADSKSFWDGLQKTEQYWGLFLNFAEEAKKYLARRPRNLHRLHY